VKKLGHQSCRGGIDRTDSQKSRIVCAGVRSRPWSSRALNVLRINSVPAQIYVRHVMLSHLGCATTILTRDQKQLGHGCRAKPNGWDHNIVSPISEVGSDTQRIPLDMQTASVFQRAFEDVRIKLDVVHLSGQAFYSTLRPCLRIMPLVYSIVEFDVAARALITRSTSGGVRRSMSSLIALPCARNSLASISFS
jgi:hypothetical protein